MGRGNNRLSAKVKRNRAQAKKKAKLKALIKEHQAKKPKKTTKK